ncbi:MAG: hypothetical protein ACSHYA_09820 [Opitutaceae bacterium]
MIDKLRNINVFVLVAGVGIGVFVHAMLRPSERFTVAAAATEKDKGWSAETDDPELLTAQLELLVAENRQLKSDLNSARRYRSSGAVRKLARNQGAKSASELIDYSKPIFRELILPEIRANREQSIQDGINQALRGRVDGLNLTDQQRQVLEERLRAQQEEKLNELERVLNDEDSSLTEYFQKQWEAERSGDPEVDAVFLDVLDPEQQAIYTDVRLEENAVRVTDDAEKRLRGLSYVVELDEAQEDAIFPIIARSQPGYRQEMQFEGVSVSDTAPISDETERDSAIQSVLRPDQMEAWETYQRRQEILGGFGVSNF